MLTAVQIQCFPTPFLWLPRKAQTEFSEVVTVSAAEPVAEGEQIWQNATLTPTEAVATRAGNPLVSYEDANVLQFAQEAIAVRAGAATASSTQLWQYAAESPTESLGVLAGEPTASNEVVWQESTLTPSESLGVLAGQPVAYHP